MIDSIVHPAESEKPAQRRLGRILLPIVCLLLFAGASSAVGQTGITSLAGTNFVTSSFSAGQVIVGAQVFSAVNISVVYNAGLSASQYVPAAQLVSQVTAAFAAYPSPTDPPEAIGSTVGQAILSQNPQINGLELTISTITIPTGIPTIGSTAGGGSYIIVLGTLGSSGAPTSVAPARKTGNRIAPAVAAQPQQQK